MTHKWSHRRFVERKTTDTKQALIKRGGKGHCEGHCHIIRLSFVIQIGKTAYLRRFLLTILLNDQKPQWWMRIQTALALIYCHVPKHMFIRTITSTRSAVEINFYMQREALTPWHPSTTYSQSERSYYKAISEEDSFSFKLSFTVRSDHRISLALQISCRY